MASAIITIGGGVAGAAIGNWIAPGVGAKWGWTIGTMITGMLVQPRPEIGKLYDRRISSSAWGSTLPKVWGYARLGGTIIWAATDSNGNILIQHQSSGSGSGGPTQDTYSETIAVAFCVGTIYKRDPSDIHGGSLSALSPTLQTLWATDLIAYDYRDATLSNELVLGSNLFWHNGAETGNGDPIIQAAMGSQTSSFPGIAYALMSNWSLVPYQETTPQISAEIATVDCNLDRVISDLCGEVGLLSGDIDVSEIASIPIKAPGVYRGVIVADTGTPQDDIRAICAGFQVDQIKSDSLIRYVPKGGAVILTIPWDDLGAVSGRPDQGRTRLDREDPNPLDLPGRVELSYIDTQRHYQQGLMAKNRADAWPVNVEQISTPVAMSEADAYQMTTQWLDMRWTEIPPYKFSLPPQYLYLCIADPVNLTLEDGSTVRVRLTDLQSAAYGEIKAGAVPDDPDMLSLAPVLTSGGGTGSGANTFTPAVTPITFICYSGTELRDGDESAPGFDTAGWWENGGSGGQIFWQAPSDTAWNPSGSITQRSVFGVATTALADASAAGFDGTHNVHVDVSETFGVLTAATLLQIEGGVNAAVLGREIIGFETPTHTGFHLYTLSDLLRGQRGSPFTGHTSSDQFMMATTALIRTTLPWSCVGQTIQVVVCAAGQTPADVTPVSVVIAAPASAPIAPTSVSDTITYTGTTEQITFSPEYTTPPTGSFTYNWQTRTSPDNVTWSAWSTTTNTPGPFDANLTTGYVEAQVQAVNTSGQVTGWVGSSSIEYFAPSNATQTNYTENIIPTGTVNGTNNVFTLPSTPATGTVKLWVDGQRLSPSQFTIVATMLTITDPTYYPSNSILVDYWK